MEDKDKTVNNLNGMVEDREKNIRAMTHNEQDDSFWWTIEFSLGGKETGGIASEDDTSWGEEILWTVATMSDAIGSELMSRNGRLILKAHYLGSESLDSLIRRLQDILLSFAGVTLSGSLPGSYVHCGVYAAALCSQLMSMARP